MLFWFVGNRGIVGARETMAETEYWVNPAEIPTRETRAHEGRSRKGWFWSMIRVRYAPTYQHIISQ